MKTISLLNIHEALTDNGAQQVKIKKCCLGYELESKGFSFQKLKKALAWNFEGHISVTDEGKGNFTISFIEQEAKELARVFKESSGIPDPIEDIEASFCSILLKNASTDPSIIACIKR